ncbi:uncharacterized protein DC041_0003187, partial [Schistosoma bovis]
VIETTIIRQWLLLSKDDKLKMRSFLKDYLHENVMDQPNFLLKKAAKLLSLTACFDWPDQYTDYMEFLKSHIFIDSSNNLTNLRTSLMGSPQCLSACVEAEVALALSSHDCDLLSALAMDRQKQAKCDDYEMKLVEIIRCILPSCLKFVYTNNNLDSKFSMDGLITFLQAFREFTFFTSNFETYLSCINIWSSVFESLQFSTYQSSDCLLSNSNVHRILSEFGNALFSRLFYSESSAYLDTLDYDIFENEMLCVSYPANNENSLLSIVFPEEFHTNNCQNNEPCEYVVFIRESLSTFHHLVGLLPHDFTVLLFQRFQCILNEYTSLVNSTGLLSGVFNYPKGQPVYRVHWILRYFASIVQVIGFMSEKFCCEKYQEYGQQILRALMYCLRLNSVIFPALHNINERLIRLSFVEKLLFSLFTSSFRDIRPPSLIIFNVNSRTFTIFNSIFDSVCEQKCQTSINYNILNSLVSSFLFYLTSENEPTSHLSNYNNTNDKQNKWITIRDSMLNRLIVQLFLPNLNQNNFEIAQKQHITYLSLLNHSILSLENAKNSTRQLVYTILINSGLMDNLVNCLLNKILINNSYSANMNSDLKIKFCTAYLIFLATFVRILSISSNSLSSIPQLIGQIIHSLCTTSSLMSVSNSFSIHVIGPIIDILLLITHQKIFLPILKDNLIYTDDVQIIHQLIMNACANNSQLIQQLFGLIFTILSNNFSFFFTLHLNASHKLFDLYDFNKSWLSVFTTSIFNLLIDNKHNSCKDTLTESVYYFAVSFTHLSCPQNSNDPNRNNNSFNDHCTINNNNNNEHQSNGLFHFVQHFLPSYLNTVENLDNSQRDSILSCFYDTNQREFYTKDITVFNHCIELLVYNIRYYRTINLAMTTVSLANSHT